MNSQSVDVEIDHEAPPGHGIETLAEMLLDIARRRLAEKATAAEKEVSA